MGQARLLTIVDAQAQLAKLDARLGVGIGAKRERAELLACIPLVRELVVDNQLTKFGQEQWAHGIITLDTSSTRECDAIDANGNSVTIVYFKNLKEYMVL